MRVLNKVVMMVHVFDGVTSDCFTVCVVTDEDTKEDIVLSTVVEEDFVAMGEEI